MTDLVEFLRARLDVDERIARDEQERRAGLHLTGVLVLDFDEFGPYRILAEVEAKRRIMNEHYSLTRWPYCSRCSDFYSVPDDRDIPKHGVSFPCPTIRALALPYQDHPDYQQEWKPA